MTELDRAVTALSDHMSNMSRQDPDLLMDPDGEKFVDQDSFNAVQGLLAQLQQEHERLMGTAAHLSHELDVNKEHVKVSIIIGKSSCVVNNNSCVSVLVMLMQN